jgi:signal transduction histidine kinase
VRSLRGTLTLWYTVALVATVLAFGVTLSVISRRATVTRMEGRLAATADLVARLLSAEHREGGAPLVEMSVDPLITQLRLDIQERLEPIPAYVIVVDSAGRAVYNSPELRRLTDFGSHEALRARVFVVNDTASHETFELPLDRDPYRFVARRVRSAGPAIIAVAVGEPARELEDAAQRLVTTMFLVSPILLLFGAGIGFVLSDRALRPVGRMMDELEAITDGRSLHRRLPTPRGQAEELARLAGAMNALLARLETSFTALRRFVADASHELKTPLTVMRAGVERALTDPQTSPDAIAPLEDTLQGVRRMTELVEALLTLARVDEGRLELHRERLDLRALLTEVHETAQILGEQAGVDVRLELPDERVAVHADRARLQQLVMNLADNAVKYTAAGGTVWLSLVATADAASVSVRDTGVGIAPGDVDRVFDRFWRADPARSRTGSRPGIGLGLSISRWIAEAHGGSIAVTSRPGRGSTFTVTLPRAAEAVTES